MLMITLLMVATGLLWGGWPLLTRAAGDTTPGTLLVIGITAAVPPIINFFLRGGELPTAGGSVLLAAAGLMMGVGLITFNVVLTSPLMPMSVSLPIMDTLLLLVGAAGAIYFFQESLTPSKLFFIGVLVVGIIGLQRS